MGLRILQNNTEVIEISPFTRRSKITRTIYVWFDLQKNQMNIECNKTLSPKKIKSLFAVNLSMQSFKEIATLGNEALQTFSKKMRTPGRHVLSRRPLKMDASVHQCVYRMTHYTGSEAVRKMYLFSELVGMLVLIQQAHEKQSTSQPIHIRNEYDKERVLYARDYLLTHLDAPPSLEQLAAITGMNVFKLKCGFKEMFGQPPFTYLADVRLEMGRTALMKKEKNITQIAFELGFASLQHFTMAFKKKFGIPPTKMR